MKKLFLIIISFACMLPVFGQCASGAMGVVGAGCGCLGGCDLTSFGGPNCGGGTSGNCSGGYTQMTDVDIAVPANCQFTVTAVMETRPGCSASGADGNCQTCDVVKVDIVGGVKIYQQGGSNASISDSYTLTGPGTIRIQGRANRADEIITWTITSGPVGTCPDCQSILPVELVEFNVIPNQEENLAEISWGTQSEENNDYFDIERSIDGIEFETISRVKGNGNSYTAQRYNFVDASPVLGKVNYYRLKQVDMNGEFEYSSIRSAYFNLDGLVKVYPNPASKSFSVLVDADTNVDDFMLSVINQVGQEIELEFIELDNEFVFDTQDLKDGVYFISLKLPNEVITKKLVVQH